MAIVTPDGVEEKDMTAEEIAAKEALDAEDKKVYDDLEKKKAQQEVDAKEGNDKLIELGLTQAQVTAMTGYTPPNEGE